VEAAVERIRVLAGAGGAHPEGRHGGGGPVVGDAERDGEARAAGGAVRERVPVAAVARVGELAQAVGAGGEVRRDGHPPLGRAAARLDLEGAERLDRDGLGAQRRDHRRLRPLGAQACLEDVERGRAPERLDGHAGRVVSHPSAEAERVREPVDEGPEPHALHRAGDGDAPPLGGR
jgi:hypothetical protein